MGRRKTVLKADRVQGGERGIIEKETKKGPLIKSGFRATLVRCTGTRGLPGATIALLTNASSAGAHFPIHATYCIPSNVPETQHVRLTRIIYFHPQEPKQDFLRRGPENAP